MRNNRAIIAAIYPVLLLAISIVHVIAPQRSGPLALTQVLAPFLFIPLVFVLPFAFIYKSRLLRRLSLVCLACMMLRFLPPIRLMSPTAAAADRQVRVLEWNVQVCCGVESQIARVRPILDTTDADIVVLEEAYWEWMRSDPMISERYPYQLSHTYQASSGLVVLSRYPILESAGAEWRQGLRGWPRLVWARLDLGAGQELLLVAAHPENPYSSNAQCKFPLCYDTIERDSLIPAIRAVIDPAVQQGGHVLLVGDMNTTEREPAYDQLARGLEDTYREVGVGLGNTWGLRPDRGWKIPLLRIDYIFHSPAVRSLSMATDCTLRGSDHCIVEGVFAIK